MDKIVIAGGSGFLGQSLIRHFSLTSQIVILTRKPAESTAGLSFVQWDGKTPGNWIHELEDATAVINLTGKSVNCRYTEKNKQEIINSRVNATLAIGEAIQLVERPPAIWINAGSTAIFGDSGNEIKNEISAVGIGFSPEVCKRWEKAFYSVQTAYTRKVLLRMGLVFQKDTGLLKPFSRLVKFGLGGKMGNGEQYISWVHEQDFTGIIQWVIDNPGIEGTIHCSSPIPVTNKTLFRELRRAYKIPFGIPSPGFLLKAGALVIGTEAELLLSGRRVVSKVLPEKGYVFKYPEIQDALDNLVKP